MAKPQPSPKFSRALTRIVGGEPRASNAALAAEVDALLQQLELSRDAAAILLGVNERTVRRWVMGDAPIGPEAVRFLRFLVRAKISPITVMETLDP